MNDHSSESQFDDNARQLCQKTRRCALRWARWASRVSRFFTHRSESLREYSLSLAAIRTLGLFGASAEVDEAEAALQPFEQMIQEAAP